MLISCRREDINDFQILQNDILRIWNLSRISDRVSIKELHAKCKIISLEQEFSYYGLSICSRGMMPLLESQIELPGVLIKQYLKYLLRYCQYMNAHLIILVLICGTICLNQYKIPRIYLFLRKKSVE